jgi:hypothetical protein
MQLATVKRMVSHEPPVRRHELHGRTANAIVVLVLDQIVDRHHMNGAHGFNRFPKSGVNSRRANPVFCGRSNSANGRNTRSASASPSSRTAASNSAAPRQARRTHALNESPAASAANLKAGSSPAPNFTDVLAKVVPPPNRKVVPTAPGGTSRVLRHLPKNAGKTLGFQISGRDRGMDSACPRDRRLTTPVGRRLQPMLESFPHGCEGFEARSPATRPCDTVNGLNP